LSPTAQGAPHKRKHKAAVQAAADAVPDFTLADVNGKNFHLRDHLGEAVLIDFWATWCGPCRMAIPHLIELQTKYKNKGFTVVGISLDQQGPDLVRNFVTTWKVNYPVVIDLDGSVARTYGGVRAIPTTVVIDAQGRVVGDPIVGYRPLEEYESLIRKALKES
jgi:thiol-disulfide isomerase/thioredoxin